MAHVSDLIASDIEAYLDAHQNKSLLRFITCGSVDDGKSTLIGRLLYDSKMVFEDQMAQLEDIPIVPLYFAAPRPTVERDGMLLMVDDDRFRLEPGEVPVERSIRFRTLGCYPLTGAVESEAASLSSVIQEMLLTTTSERQGRAIDRDAGSASMEKKKQEGYF